MRYAFFHHNIYSFGFHRDYRGATNIPETKKKAEVKKTAKKGEKLETENCVWDLSRYR